MNTIEDVLRVERARLNMSVDEMCKQANIPRQTYYSMRSVNFKSLRACDLVSLANVFKCSTDYLLGRTTANDNQTGGNYI